MPRRPVPLAIIPTLLSLALVAGCESRPSRPAAGTLTGPAPPFSSQEVSAPQDEDYAKARASYTSKLIYTGQVPTRTSRTGAKDLAPKDAKAPDELPYSSDGLALRAFVTADPGDGKKHPAVVFLNEGFNLDKDGWALALAFHKAGFVAMAPMLRGENMQKGGHTTFYREVDDVLAATEALAKLAYVDGSEVYLAGVREGGTQALLCAMASGRYKAVAAVNPELDMAAFSAKHREFVAFDRRDVREFQLRSPLAYAASLKCPARVYVPAGDAEAEAAALEFAKRAKAKSIQVEAETVPIPTRPPPKAGEIKKFAASRNPPKIDAEALGRSVEFFRSRGSSA